MGIGAEVCDTTCIENRITVDMNNYIIIRNAIPQNLFFILSGGYSNTHQKKHKNFTIKKLR